MSEPPPRRPRARREGIRGIRHAVCTAHRYRRSDPPNEANNMRGPLRGLLAGAAAYRFGGGCLGTLIVFVLVFWLLGNC
jgi:hypothetical protein